MDDLDIDLDMSLDVPDVLAVALEDEQVALMQKQINLFPLQCAALREALRKQVQYSGNDPLAKENAERRTEVNSIDAEQAMHTPRNGSVDDLGMMIVSENATTRLQIYTYQQAFTRPRFINISATPDHGRSTSSSRCTSITKCCCTSDR